MIGKDKPKVSTSSVAFFRAAGTRLILTNVFNVEFKRKQTV